MTKEDNEDFKNSTKYCICDNHYVENDVKVRDHCYITEKYRGSTHRDCNINLKLNKKTHVIFPNLKNYDFHLIMKKQGKFNLNINVILNRLENYMSITINNKLSFINSFQFVSSSLNLSKDGFKYLSQEFDNNVLDLVKQKEFYPYEYMSNFEKFKKELSSKEMFYSSLTDRKISGKECEHVLNVWNRFEMKLMKDHHNLYLK